MQIEVHFLSIAFHVLSYITTVLLSSVYQINLCELGTEMEVYVAATNRYTFFFHLSCSTDYEMAPEALLSTAVPLSILPNCWVSSWCVSVGLSRALLTHSQYLDGDSRAPDGQFGMSHWTSCASSGMFSIREI